MQNTKKRIHFEVNGEGKGFQFFAIILFLLLNLSFSTTYAQNAVPASGGNASGSAGSVSYTVGQVVYTTNTGTNGSVAQGVEQPYEISVETGIDQFKNIDLICSVFPNPTTDFLTLKIEGEVSPQFMVSLFDINGKLLLTKNLESSETTIPMGRFVPATYFLKVMQINQSASPKDIKSFKIIKK